MDEPNTIQRHEFDAVIQRLDAENDRQNHRIDVLERLTESVQKLAVNMENMVTEQKTQSERLSKLENRDGERWRSVVATALTALVGGIVAAVLSKLGMI